MELKRPARDKLEYRRTEPRLFSRKVFYAGLANFNTQEGRIILKDSSDDRACV